MCVVLVIVLYLLMSEVLANHISENAEETFHIICSGGSWMFTRNTILSVKPLAPFSTSNVHQQC